jgi:hypothetical protein
MALSPLLATTTLIIVLPVTNMLRSTYFGRRSGE